MRKLILLLLCLAPWTLSMAQIVATTEVVDFGTLKEEEGRKSLRVFVKNISDAPQSILKVRPACGCTAADFQKDTFMPGDSAWIDLTYNPFRRPGKFEKEVKVVPTEGDPMLLTITGTVLASEATLSQLYPSSYGCLRLTEESFMPVHPLTREIKTFIAGFYNSCDHPLFLNVEAADNALGVDWGPSPISPGEKGYIEISLNPLKESRSGNLEYTLLLRAAEDEQSLPGVEPKRLRINATINPKTE